MEKEKIMEAIELAVEIDNIEMFEILLKDFDLNALDEDDLFAIGREAEAFHIGCFVRESLSVCAVDVGGPDL